MKIRLTIRELEICRRELIRQGWINRHQYDQLSKAITILREVEGTYKTTEVFGQESLEFGNG